MKFNPANDKLKKLYKPPVSRSGSTARSDVQRLVYSFDLLSGVFCPMAMLCRSRAKVDEQTGKRSFRMVLTHNSAASLLAKKCYSLTYTIAASVMVTLCWLARIVLRLPTSCVQHYRRMPL